MTLRRRELLLIGSATLMGAPLLRAAPAGNAPTGALAQRLLDEPARVIARAIAKREVSVVDVVSECLRRIAAIDQAGPTLRSVIEVNPDALAIARELDKELRRNPNATKRGPLYGVPVLIKDNIDTADKMETTAGSLALVGAKRARDAVLVENLRAAGLVILGKTNLSEWANIRSYRSTSGWSARGGYTKNPHVLDRNPAGSSSGSAAAVAAGLAPLAVGTETDGSIVAPASFCGVVGVKPTLGLVSQRGIIPVSAAQDTAGPMARSVDDAALLLDAMMARPAAAARKASADVNANALKGCRIAVRRIPTHPDVDALFDAALAVLKAEGAVLVDVDMPPIPGIHEAELTALKYELKAGLDAYLAALPSSPVRTIADVVAFNRAHHAQELSLFGQEIFEEAAQLGPLTTPEYVEARRSALTKAREAVDQLLRAHLQGQKLDVAVVTTNAPAHMTDAVNGDTFGWIASTLPAIAGTPHATVPMGLVRGALPVGLSFLGAANDDAKVLAIAAAYERATQKIARPAFLPTLPL